MTDPLRTCVVPMGALNPPEDESFQRKYNPAEDSIFACIVDSSFRATYGPKKSERPFWFAYILRVDEYEDEYVKLQARVPEKDPLAEPVECVSPEVPSFSHPLIDMHPTYEGKVPYRPRIGQIIAVVRPPDDVIYAGMPGEIVKLTNEYVERGIKSTKVASGAKKAADAPQDATATPSIPGDGIGSGEKNSSKQSASS